MRPVQDPDLPCAPIAGYERIRERRGSVQRRQVSRRRQTWISNRQDVSRTQRPAGMAAKLSVLERGATTEIQRNVQAVAHRQIGSASAGRFANAQGLSRFDIDRYPEQYRIAIQRRVGRRAGQSDNRIAMKPQRRPKYRRFNTGSMRLITDDPVSQPERPVIHWP